jgi:hypothetical protein
MTATLVRRLVYSELGLSETTETRLAARALPARTRNPAIERRRERAKGKPFFIR